MFDLLDKNQHINLTRAGEDLNENLSELNLRVQAAIGNKHSQLGGVLGNHVGKVQDIDLDGYFGRYQIFVIFNQGV